MDEQEIEALKQKAEELEKFKNDSAPKLEEFEKARTEWQAKEKEYQEQVNPNWKKAREEMNALRKVAEAKGIEFNEDGTPKLEDKFSMEEVIKQTQETTRKEFLNNRLDELLETYTPEEAKVVRKQYEKLIVGENVTMQNIRSFVSSAEGASGFSGPSKISRVMGAGGQGPRFQAPEVDKLDDGAAKDVAALMQIKLK